MEIVNFLNSCRGSPFNVCAGVSSVLQSHGFVQLSESAPWSLQRGGKYFYIKDLTTVCAFAVGGNYEVGNGFSIVGSHTDSPSLKLKPNPFDKSNELDLVRCELYGGGNWPSWFDRDLGVCGRVITQDGETLKNAIVKIEEPIYRICTCAPHLDKRYGKGFVIDKETELPAIGLSEQDLMEKLSTQVNGTIVGMDLYLYDIDPISLSGVSKEFITGQGLDNTTSVYADLFGLLEATSEESLKALPNVLMAIFFDNEEVGSTNRRGANSAMTEKVVRRICSCFDMSPDFEQKVMVGESKTFVLSNDVNHASHPNYIETSEKRHLVYMNSGIVFETNANQKLLCDSIDFKIVSEIAKISDVKLQKLVAKQGLLGGSTIAPKMASSTGFHVIDCGVPLLAMHSIREIGGVFDILGLTNLVRDALLHLHEHQALLI
uniref:aspartyl aminopeptidase n=1 Tax=Entamoeba invadens TaxID=33085 RepID=S0B8W8_ENTIV|nr:hypothetical protein, conserved [Entamoeba invadens]